MEITSIDIFCHVIDNYGDAGVVYRFAKELKKTHPQCCIRVFIDKLETLHSIIPVINPKKTVQQYQSVTFIDSSALSAQDIAVLGVADIMVEAFACEIPQQIMDTAIFKSKLIVNLEYLSAEDWVEGYHLKESLLNNGTAKKIFFMPGFTTQTGGIILNSDLLDYKATNAYNRLLLVKELLKYHLGLQVQDRDENLFGTIFSYERGFDNLLKNLLKIQKTVYLMIFGEKSHKSMRASLEREGIYSNNEGHILHNNIHLCFLPLLVQEDYDRLLCCADFNLVRGEDSLVRAICAGKPFIWNAYLQDKGYQSIKVDAFLENFRQYFEDSDVFNRYKEVMQQYNKALSECSEQKTIEKYQNFFADLNKIEHATQKMSYFIENNCNLIHKFSDFLREFKI